MLIPRLYMYCTRLYTLYAALFDRSGFVLILTYPKHKTNKDPLYAQEWG